MLFLLFSSSTWSDISRATSAAVPPRSRISDSDSLVRVRPSGVLSHSGLAPFVRSLRQRATLFKGFIPVAEILFRAVYTMSSSTKNLYGACSKRCSRSTEGSVSVSTFSDARNLFASLANAGEMPYGASGTAVVSNKADHMGEEPQDDCELLEEGEIPEGGEILQDSETLKEGEILDEGEILKEGEILEVEQITRRVNSPEPSYNVSPNTTSIDMVDTQTAVAFAPPTTSTSPAVFSNSHKRKVPAELPAEGPNIAPKKRLKTSDGAGATAQVTASVKPQASSLPNEPDIANADLDSGSGILRREHLPRRTSFSPCVFGFIHETEKPSMVGSTANDTHDWQAVLRINAVRNNHPGGLTLQIRVANVQRHVPINHYLNDSDESSLSWNVPYLHENRALMIRSLNSCPFDEWYEKATPKVQALPIIQKVRRESIYRSMIVIECLTGRSFLFNDFQRSKRWERLPAELMTQVGKARTGMDIMTFIIARGAGVVTSLQWLEEDTFFSQ